MGCKAFALLFDDIDPVLCASDMDEFESSANAQASITNMMFEALDKPRFLFCPTGSLNSIKMVYCFYWPVSPVNIDIASGAGGLGFHSRVTQIRYSVITASTFLRSCVA